MKLAKKTIAKISSFFRGSAKRVEFLKTVIAAENDSRITTELVRMCETRFIERHTSIEVLQNLLVYVIKALHGMQSWNNSETAGDAYTLENSICSQRFVSSLVMLEHITSKHITIKASRCCSKHGCSQRDQRPACSHERCLQGDG